MLHRVRRVIISKCRKGGSDGLAVGVVAQEVGRVRLRWHRPQSSKGDLHRVEVFFLLSRKKLFVQLESASETYPALAVLFAVSAFSF